MLSSLIQLYRASWRYALACPLLFFVPIVAESAQHVVEYGQGFYTDIGHARATEHNLLRMGFGTAKVLSLFIARYWVIRWLEWGDRVRTMGFDWHSIATFTPLLALELALALPTIWIPVFAPALARPLLLLSSFSFLIGLLVSDWSRTAALGESGGPIESARRVSPIFLWALGFNLAAILPPMIVHYALGMGAMKAHGVIQFVALGADTVFVGYLGTILCSVSWFVSERARQIPVESSDLRENARS